MSDDPKTSALSPWTASLRQAGRRSDPQAILSHPNSAKAVGALTELEAYHLVKELGLGEAPVVLSFLRPAQIQALFDLDAWRGPEFDPDDAVLWFEAFRAAGMDALHAARQQLDPETLALMLRRRLLISLAEREDDTDPPPMPDWMLNPPAEIEPLMTTPDRRFVVAARAHDEVSGELIEDEARKSILELVDAFYRDERWEEVANALRQAESEFSSSLEEEAGRFRQARLEDLGFVPLSRALEVYGLLDPSGLDADVTPEKAPLLDERLPATYHAALHEGLFAAAAQGLTDEEAVRLEGDLLPVMNAVLVADGIEPADMEGVRSSLSAARGRIDVALAHGSLPQQRLELATERLRKHHPQSLLRMGHTIIARQGTAAVKERDLWRQRQVPLDDGRAALLDALTARRPRVVRALDPLADAIAEGHAPPPVLPPEGADEVRAFERVGDVEAVDLVLRQLEALRNWPATAALTAERAFPPPDERNVLLVMRTRGSNAMLERPLDAPLDAEAIAELAERSSLNAAAQGSPGFAAKDLARAETELALPAPLRSEFRWAMTTLAHDLFGLVGAEVDLRFVGGILVEIPG